MASLTNTNEFLTDLFNHRPKSYQGHNAITLLSELYGGSTIQLQSYEPDPITFRSQYYYNTSLNILYKKIISKSNNNVTAYWKKVSQ